MKYELIKRNEIIDGKKPVYSLETERLNLIPLQPYQLELAIDNYEEMQIDLGLRVINAAIDEEMDYVMKIRLKRVLEDVKNYLWLTNWAIIHKEEKQIIGFIILKGVPNEFGEVIVGYVVEDSHQRKGYATEAIKALIKWVFQNPQALSVIIDTEKDNLPSNKLLEKLGAVKYKETDELFWWRIVR